MFKNNDEEDLFSDVPGIMGMPESKVEMPEERVVAKPELSELAALQKEQDAANDKKAYLKIAGGIAQNFSDAPMASEIYYKRNNPKANVKGMFDAAADTVGDPMDKSKKAQEYLKMKREGRAGERQERMAQDADDVGSADAESYRKQLYALAPSLQGKLEGMSLTQMERTSPILMAKIRGDIDKENARIAAGEKNRAADLARQDKLDARADKQKELSTTQAKQRGLYEMGKKSEEQFNAATASKDGYDPTSVSEFIDNSSWAPNWMKNDKAVESQSASNSWIESYLRDASGAAIPDSERKAYAKIYFPQPGDNEKVVANKAALRAQKMDSARIAAGVETGHGPADQTMQASDNGDSVEMFAPDGTKKRVKKAQVQAALAAGGKLVNAAAIGAK